MLLAPYVPIQLFFFKGAIAFSHKLLHSRDSKGNILVAMNSNYFNSDKDPVPVLARAVKELGGSDNT